MKPVQPFNLSLHLKKQSDLQDYEKKRDFTATPEPAPKEPEKKETKTNRHSFVVQRHEAKKAGLHYDLRLEDYGVLKSWAVPKGMPPEGEKHLAIAVEDHPYSYKDFQGTISEGYGAGEVAIDASSEYETIEKDNKKWKFKVLSGKYEGVWTLVNMRDKQWLLIKIK